MHSNMPALSLRHRIPSPALAVSRANASQSSERGAQTQTSSRFILPNPSNTTATCRSFIPYGSTVHGRNTGLATKVLSSVSKGETTVADTQNWEALEEGPALGASPSLSTDPQQDPTATIASDNLKENGRERTVPPHPAQLPPKSVLTAHNSGGRDRGLPQEGSRKLPEATFSPSRSVSRVRRIADEVISRRTVNVAGSEWLDEAAFRALMATVAVPAEERPPLLSHPSMQSPQALVHYFAIGSNLNVELVRRRAGEDCVQCP